MYIKANSVTITIIMEQFIKNDTDFDISSKARRGVMEALSAYQ